MPDGLAPSADAVATLHDLMARFAAIGATADGGVTRLEVQAEAENDWVDAVVRAHEKLLARRSQGWFTGYNSNVPGHEQGRIRYFVYNGGAPKYVSIINQVVADGYAGVDLMPATTPATEPMAAGVGDAAG